MKELINNYFAMKFALYLLFFIGCSWIVAGQELIKTIHSPNTRLMSTDESGNLYLVRTDNSITRYNADGDSTGNFRTVINGDLEWVDATNPLKILLFYPAFAKVILLDRMMAPKNELDLRKINIFNAPAVGMSVDGRIWVYDFQNARLRKIDDQLNIVSSGNDMRQEIQLVPHPGSLLERDYKVFLADPELGILVFDRFAGYTNTLDIKNVEKIQAFGTQLVYRTGNELTAYDTKIFEQKTIALPTDNDFIDARVERNRFYLLFKNKVEIYSLSPED